MEMKPVVSSNIKAIGYDPATRVMAVQFANGTYHYDDVGQEQHDAFVAAESIGSHFHKNFRSLKGVRQP